MQNMKKYCFSMLNRQICDVLVTVFVVVRLNLFPISTNYEELCRIKTVHEKNWCLERIWKISSSVQTPPTKLPSENHHDFTQISRLHLRCHFSFKLSNPKLKF